MKEIAKIRFYFALQTILIFQIALQEMLILICAIIHLLKIGEILTHIQRSF